MLREAKILLPFFIFGNNLLEFSEVQRMNRIPLAEFR